ncbi:hypothetical protein BC826DRAFT_161026 [Russula brevipes]|nr:hypothetical protein BC826DRAFT_161026 [Russula brevipes]
MEKNKRNTDAHASGLLDTAGKIVRRRLGDAIYGQVPVQAPFVDLEERAPSALARRPLLPERGSEVRRVLLQRRLVQPKLGLLDLDDGAVGVPKVWISPRSARTRARARRPPPLSPSPSCAAWLRVCCHPRLRARHHPQPHLSSQSPCASDLPERHHHGLGETA